VDLDALSGPRVRYAGADTGTGEIRCRFVVDASGQSAVLSRQMGTRDIDEDFRFVAMWGYFDDSRYVAADGCAYPFEPFL
jgi:flavin-dependent dehydrogenase